MRSESKWQLAVGLAEDAAGMVVTAAGLLVYAVLADAQVYWLKATFRGKQADALAEKQAREFREILGFPEDGECPE
jgi:hypothetical protein